MFQNLPTNRVVIWALFLIVAFICFLNIFETSTLIIVLNGALTGCGVAVAITFWRLFWQAVLGLRPYSDVKQMAISIVLLWSAIGLAVAGSIQLRITGVPASPLVTTVAMRYIAIIAAVMQVTVPDYGFGPFYGTERKSLWIGVSCGVIAAVAIIFLQVGQVFAA